MARNGWTREGILQIYSDVHKSAYGFRPRGENLDALTDEQLFDKFDRICADNEAEIAREEEAHAEALFKWRAEIAERALAQNVSKARAILWDMVAHNADYGFDQYCYERHLDYTVQAEIREVFAQDGMNEAEAVRYVRAQTTVAA